MNELLKFSNNKMQSSLDKLNLGPRLAKEKPKLKDDKQRKSQKKVDEKLYKWC